MQHDVDEVLIDFETIAISENEKDDDAIPTPIEVGVFKKFIAFSFFLNVENGKLVRKVKYLGIQNLNIKENDWPLRIVYDKVCIQSPNGQCFIDLTGHKFFQMNRGKIMHVENDKVKETINITNHGLLKIVNFDRGFKDVYMKASKATRN
ncbi:27460_t:CDS:2 [Gigaspora margarita]|uniref:27460_t:CDS:1 n=1 Tax=Gigaspora margarita TaxID=4874 RepID=A0ABN7W1S9_GIGMA|nr:27460_t:CDS:2 [Gigaspora margarita]